MTRRSYPSLSLELASSGAARRIGHHAARWGLLMALAGATFVLFPVARTFDAPVLTVGEVAPEEIIAPFAFEVKKSPTEFEAEAEALAATALPIYDYRPGVVDTVVRRTDSLFTLLRRTRAADARVAAAQAFGVRLSPEEIEYLAGARRLVAFRSAVRRLFQRHLPRGVPATGTVDADQTRDILVRRPGGERVARRDTVFTYARLLDSRLNLHPDPNSSIGDQLYVKFLNGLFQPTLAPNRSATDQVRRELRASVDSVKDRVQAQERIIDANEVVTPDVRDRLLGLKEELVRQGGRREGNVRGMAGQILTNAAVLAVFWLLLMFYRRDTYDNLRHIGVLALLFGLAIAGARVNWQFLVDGPELIPIPFAAMLITVLFSGRVAMVAAIVLALLIGSQAAFGGVDAIFLALVGGVTAAVSVREVRRRNQFLASFLLVTLGFLLASLILTLRLDWALADLGRTVLFGGLNAFLSAALALTVLPLLETLASRTTDLTLLELSDPNQALLRRLATEAPGTYAHSIAMANLCERACNAVGANGLLARVGCYYHDIGKLKKPQFFVENQVPGTNPHDKLKPDGSAGIIRNHVRDGLTLAEEHKLPQAVKAFIPEHHGTMDISYFLDRARSRNDGEEIDPELFRYPGPRPRSVETAVTMLADGVEAALRVLDEPTPQKLSDAIDHIVRQRIEAGQLDETPLTFAQLTRIKEEFMRVLAGVHHNRIDYPASSGGIGAEWEAASSQT